MASCKYELLPKGYDALAFNLLSGCKRFVHLPEVLCLTSLCSNEVNALKGF